MLNNIYKEFHNKIITEIANDRIFTDSLHTLAYGTDASFYRLIPRIVIKAIDEKEVSLILKYASQQNLPVVFRAAGTSLSGQAITDSILVVCAFGWRGIKVLNEAKQIRLQPGVVGAHANVALKYFGRKIGPDPASINSAQIGGIAANNASGMCCGIDKNSYKTLKDIRIILNDGTILDTSDEKSKENFLATKSELVSQLKELVNEIKENKSLYNKIVRKYSIKNTTGYSLNALIDFENEIDIIAHLMIGSEGTLGFISSITYNTVEEPKVKASSIILFEDIFEACKFVADLKQEKDLVNAAELMDRASLKSIEDKEGVDPLYKTLHDDVASILVECGSVSKEDLETRISKVKEMSKKYKLVENVKFEYDPKEYAKLWAIRKGTFPTVGAMRESGTTVIIEDVAFAVEDLASGVIELQELFKKYNYTEAIIFGHALEGNVHFVFTQDFSLESEVKRYENFMDDVCTLVAVKYKGSLKAEHGTGRNMAPFVEMEWGEDAYILMKKIKIIFDPNNLLNPGVIINEDKKAHLKNLKFMPAFNPIADKCIECGFCEPICPSKDLTLTPRQRIAVNREIQRRKENNEQYKELEKLYIYDGEETCAVDGLCATACPVDINTGALTKDIRDHRNSKLAKSVSSVVAKNYGETLFSVRQGFKALNFAESIIKPSGMRKIRKLIPAFPYWFDSMPRVASYTKTREVHTFSKNVVYFSSCINRAFGASKEAKDTRDINQVVESLLKKSHYNIIYPKKDKSLCCGVPFESKGFTKDADEQLEVLLLELFEASNNGEYPILCDNSPCSYRMITGLKKMNMKVYEPIDFSLEFLVPELNIDKSDEAIVLHTTCSSKKMKLDDKFEKLANILTDDVTIPENINCCGFAGDRGFNFPELNTSALAGLKSQLKPDIKRGFSTSKTCEIGLSHNSQKDYSSILYLLDECSNEK
jgi:D-lactate dehydrogenase